MSPPRVGHSLLSTLGDGIRCSHPVRLPLGEVHWIYQAMIMALGCRLQVLMCSHLALVVSAIGFRAACRAILLAVLSQLCCHLRRHSLCPIDRWALSTWACPGQ